MFRSPYRHWMPPEGYPPDFYPRQRMPRHHFVNGYAGDFARRERQAMAVEEMLYEEAYGRPIRGRGFSTPMLRPRRLRMPPAQKTADYSRHIIQNTIRKTQERLLASQFAKDSTSPSIVGNSVSNSVASTITPENKPSEPEPIAIGPRIPAKQLWESCYREVVSEEQETKSLQEVTPGPTYQTPSQAAKNKKNCNFRNKKFKPYYKKKTKGKNADTEDESKDGEYLTKCQFCDIKMKDETEEKTHKETEEHKKNVNKFISGDNQKAQNTSLEKLNESLPLPTNTPECTKWGRDTGDRTVNTIHFCRLCSVSMTSLTHASQHYAGKLHAKRIRIVQRENRPQRKPFAPTKFVSGGVLGMQTKSIPNYSLPSYGYGIQTQSTSLFSATYTNPVMVQATPQSATPVVVPATPVYHQPTDALCAPGTSSLNLKPNLPGDFANSMTPSGQYYCATCNVVIEHASKLNSHLQSKAHKQAKAMAH